MRVRALGGLSVERVTSAEPPKARRGHGTTLQVLEVVLSHGGAPVPAQRVADLVWPQTDGDHAMDSLKVALSRLRRLGLAEGGKAIPWIHSHDQHVVVDPSLCSVDCFAVADLLDHALSRPDDLETLRVAVDSYTGDFLDGGGTAPHALAFRQRLQDRHRAACAALER